MGWGCALGGAGCWWGGLLARCPHPPSAPSPGGRRDAVTGWAEPRPPGWRRVVMRRLSMSLVEPSLAATRAMVSGWGWVMGWRVSGWARRA